MKTRLLRYEADGTGNPLALLTATEQAADHFGVDVFVTLSEIWVAIINVALVTFIVFLGFRDRIGNNTCNHEDGDEEGGNARHVDS
ncbi:hypothetical protein ONZ45_g11573 [Pleurotus djamor]|nr:hypothetical protein ONZ45_g11573 [Pleurotus djamor]